MWIHDTWSHNSPGLVEEESHWEGVGLSIVSAAVEVGGRVKFRTPKFRTPTNIFRYKNSYPRPILQNSHLPPTPKNIQNIFKSSLKSSHCLPFGYLQHFSSETCSKLSRAAAQRDGPLQSRRCPSLRFTAGSAGSYGGLKIRRINPITLS